MPYWRTILAVALSVSMLVFVIAKRPVFFMCFEGQQREIVGYEPVVNSPEEYDYYPVYGCK